MKKCAKILGVIAGVLAMFVAVYFTRAFLDILMMVQEMKNYSAYMRYFGEEFQVPWKELLTAALGVVAQYGMAVNLLKARKGGALGGFIGLMLLLNVLSANHSAYSSDTLSLVEMICGVILYLALALECGIQFEIPRFVKAIVLIGGTLAVESLGLIGADLGALLSSPLNFAVDFAVFLSMLLTSAMITFSDKEWI